MNEQLKQLTAREIRGTMSTIRKGTLSQRGADTMPNPDSTPALVTLAAWFVETSAGKLAGELAKSVVMLAGLDTLRQQFLRNWHGRLNPA